MAIERHGQFIEFTGDHGLRHVVRVTAIQCISDSDEMANETHLTVANKTVLVPSPLDEVRDALMEDGYPKWRPTRSNDVES
jgi:hypothetical protein